MNEVRQTTFGILSLYMTSTLAFLAVIFGTWYFGELNALKTSPFYEVKRLSKAIIAVLERKGKYGYYIQSAEGEKSVLRAISAESRFPIMVFDARGNLVYNNTPFSAKDIPLQEGIYLVGNHVVLNTLGVPDFLPNEKKKRFNLSDKRFRIVIDGGDIGTLLWNLRLKVWGLFALLSLMMGVVGFFLVRLALRPIDSKFKEIDAFIKDTTHEINTPLSILQMSVEQIDVSQIPASQFKKIRYIQIASKTLTNLYNSLVYASFGRVEKHIERFNVAELVGERLDFFTMLFDQKSIFCKRDLREVWLEGDKASLSLVIDNLLSNAYKYTQRGGEVQVSLKASDQTNVLKIQDNGYGIRQEDLPFIFHRYERFDEGSGGFGLGLNIVKKICDDMQITIACESEVKKGSKFTLSWKKGEE